MEESEKRRERLKALRTEAAEGGADSNAGYSMGSSYSLVNPLAEASSVPPVHMEPNVAPRFDFYTDPMSAFSANKRTSKVSHQISPDYFTPPSMTPAYQAQKTYDLDQSISQSPVPHCSSGPFGSPMRSPNTLGTPPKGNMDVGRGTYGFPMNFSRGGNFPRPDFVQRGSPVFDYNRGRGYGFNNSPQTGSGNRGRPYPQSGRGRNQWLGGNSPQTGSGNWGGPYLHSGRGRGHRWVDNSPGSNQSGSKVGSSNNVSAELRPDLYYDKSMLEDPWKMLKPVVSSRKGSVTSLDTPDSKSWLPKSISAKKARVWDPVAGSSSGKSLAEELAASFNEAAKSEPLGDDSEGDL